MDNLLAEENAIAPTAAKPNSSDRKKPSITAMESRRSKIDAQKQKLAAAAAATSNSSITQYFNP